MDVSKCYCDRCSKAVKPKNNLPDELKEAHEELENLQRLLTQYRPLFSKSLIDAIGAGILSIEKRIEQEPKKDTEYHSEGRCPSCGVFFMDRNTSYCGNCGQRIKWGKE